MFTTVQKWGNSHGIRIPKDYMEKIHLQENDQVEIQVLENQLIIKPVKKHIILQERIAEYSSDYVCHEWETGDGRGKEEF